ncbi:MAG: glycine cleavage system protein GcvH [Desulfarculaceae bacterium]|nr:glycine cleavage system protein GcvH [Desulfarculaceae bacterium]MCF8047897.1 glycine cleavage system protein GcvH [Desulfarculaceae bacterium]MCF8066198.1 glycine cleavage system protein GcvH [Desulfarculaceae bacterium]MCF8099048.1 glycine cleavage system protein GcvH [Desulfarculaceae bacterium]MCF8122482.1 glycine cleavage system protein GcvH [Desulfarculaceae bacterium]
MSEAKKAPEGLYYTKEHEWVKLEGGLAVVGLTDFAQDQLGDITYVELPEVEAEVEQMGEMCVVESVKTAADVYAPLSGTVAEVNSALEDAPELINQDCYGAGWLVKLSGFDQAELDNLMDAGAYVQLMTEGE